MTIEDQAILKLQALVRKTLDALYEGAMDSGEHLNLCIDLEQGLIEVNDLLLGDLTDEIGKGQK